MNRFTALILAGFLVMSLAACAKPPVMTQEASAAPELQTAETPAPDPQTPVLREPEETPEPEADERTDTENMYIEVNGQRFALTLAENETAEAFRALLPAAWDMEELNGNEKFIYLDESLPSASEAVGQIEAGDLMLYGGSCVVLFYESFSTPYSYTRIGRLDDPRGIAEAVGGGDVTVSFQTGE